MTGGAAGFLAVAFLVMILLGYFSIVLVCSGRISNKLAWALAPPVGMGLCSIIFFVFRRPMFTVELSLLAVLLMLWLRYRARTPDKRSASEERIPVLAGWMIGALAWVILASFIWVQHLPHGEWDGRAIWNSHARYLYRAGPVWTQHIKNSAHPDYPLLLPAATARTWRYIGKDVPEAGGVQLLLIAISGIMVLAASLWEFRKSSLSFLVPLLLIGTPSYLILAIWQYAEVPLSVYILSTIALLCVHWEREPDQARIVAIAGFTAGCAAWTKNEGLLFVLATSGLLFVPVFWQRVKTIRRMAMFFLGLLLPLAMTVYFKFAVAPPNDIVNSSRMSGEVISKVLDSGRYMTISSAFLDVASSFGRLGNTSGDTAPRFLVGLGHRSPSRAQWWMDHRSGHSYCGPGRLFRHLCHHSVIPGLSSDEFPRQTLPASVALSPVLAGLAGNTSNEFPP